MDLQSHLADEIGWLVLNRPQVRNALSKSMWDAIPQNLDQLRNAGAKVIIFKGEGPAFAAGADLQELEKLENETQAQEHWFSIRNALNAVAESATPTIAMINGACLGGGCLLSCACDLRICEEAAVFSVPVAQLGIVLDGANVARLLNTLGRGNTLELLLTGAAIDSNRALQIGLVNHVVPPTVLQSKTLSIARAICSNAGTAIQAIKQSISAMSATLTGDDSQERVISSYISAEFKSRLSKALGKE